MEQHILQQICSCSWTCVPRNQLPLFPSLKSCIQQLNSISLRQNMKVKNQAPFHGITSRARLRSWQHRQRNEAKTTSVFFFLFYGKVQSYAGVPHRCTHGTKIHKLCSMNYRGRIPKGFPQKQQQCGLTSWKSLLSCARRLDASVLVTW